MSQPHLIHTVLDYVAVCGAVTLLCCAVYFIAGLVIMVRGAPTFEQAAQELTAELTETTESKPTRRELFEQTVPAPGCSCSACMAYRRGTWRTK